MDCGGPARYIYKKCGTLHALLMRKGDDRGDAGQIAIRGRVGAVSRPNTHIDPTDDTYRTMFSLARQTDFCGSVHL